MKSYAYLIALVALLVSVFLQGDLRAHTKYRAQDGSITVGHTRMEFISPRMVRLQFSPKAPFVD